MGVPFIQGISFCHNKFVSLHIDTFSSYNFGTCNFVSNSSVAHPSLKEIGESRKDIGMENEIVETIGGK